MVTKSKLVWAYWKELKTDYTLPILEIPGRKITKDGEMWPWCLKSHLELLICGLTFFPKNMQRYFVYTCQHQVCTTQCRRVYFIRSVKWQNKQLQILWDGERAPKQPLQHLYTRTMVPIKKRVKSFSIFFI